MQTRKQKKREAIAKLCDHGPPGRGGGQQRRVRISILNPAEADLGAMDVLVWIVRVYPHHSQ